MDLDKEELIQELDRVRDLVYAEHELALKGHSEKKESQLSFIIKELHKMRRELDKHKFSPYYPRGIADEWSFDDPLGAELLKVARDYNCLSCKVCNMEENRGKL